MELQDPICACNAATPPECEDNNNTEQSPIEDAAKNGINVDDGLVQERAEYGTNVSNQQKSASAVGKELGPEVKDACDAEPGGARIAFCGVTFVDVDNCHALKHCQLKGRDWFKICSDGILMY